MDTNLANLANSLTEGRSAAGFHVRDEDGYYTRFGGDLDPRARSTSGAAGFRAIAATFALVILYCVLVPYSPALLFWLA